ncbi:MAG: hypothetical protein V4650_07905 [Pseudomonadota bacterium]
MIELIGSDRRVLRALLLAALVSGSTLAQAEVASRMEAFRITTDAKGKEQAQPATTTNPGDVIEYRIRYENTDPKPVTQLAVSGPVPKGTALVADSVKSPVKHAKVYSTDGGKSYQAAPVRRKNASGELETVPASEYTAVQWQVQEPLKQGAPQQFSYRVRVNAVAVPEKK